jgi:signal transduction histidine kinase
LPVEGLEVRVHGNALLSADPDLLAASLANLLDNAQRYGARQVDVSVPSPDVVRVADDGRGATAERLHLLREAIRTQDYGGATGLGLMLADLVVRSHGGSLRLPESAQGFVVELALHAEPADER